MQHFDLYVLSVAMLLPVPQITQFAITVHDIYIGGDWSMGKLVPAVGILIYMIMSLPTNWQVQKLSMPRAMGV